MIEISGRTIRIAGTPRLILSGEVHYFRLEREDWSWRLDAAAEAGFTAIASYIPWLVHELPDGSFDLEGRTHPANDLGAFIDMVAERGMHFIARPGPYVMAEMKNEGLPYRLWDIPEIIPRGWDGADAPNPTLDLANPKFLAEVEKWYAALGPVLGPRMIARGGPIILVQLDNEIGMLDWVSNTPCLTEDVLAHFTSWLGREYESAELARRYPRDLLDPQRRFESIASPAESYATALRLDLCRFMRQRFSDYTDALAELARTYGFGTVPFVINIHGTSAGYAHTFPIGISQLLNTYAKKPGFISGSDIYLGQPNLRSFSELHMINAMMESLHDADQPVTSMEFEVGTTDYSESLEALIEPSSAQLKAHLCVAQNHRLINAYLLAGGRNRKLNQPRGDGNDRIATTGERHGFAAPLDPEGARSLAWDPTVAMVRALRANEPWLADAIEERDNVALGWFPDHFMTEYHYPHSASDRELVRDLEAHRSGGPRFALPRMLLYSGFRYSAVNLQEDRWWAKSGRPDVVALAPTGQMEAMWQQGLVEFVRAGGGLLLYGRIPVLDLEGAPCTILADAMGVRYLGMKHDSHRVWQSVQPAGWASASPEHPRRAEFRCGYAHLWDPGETEVLGRLVLTGDAVAMEARVGDGRIIAFTADYPVHLDVAAEAITRLGGRRGLVHTGKVPGVVMTTTVSNGNRLLHIMNVTGYSDTATIELDGQPLFGGREITIAPYSSHMLPVGIDLPIGAGSARVRWATAEVAQITPTSSGSSARVAWRLTQNVDQIQFDGPVRVAVVGRSDVVVEELDEGTRVSTMPRGLAAAARTSDPDQLLLEVWAA